MSAYPVRYSVAYSLSFTRIQVFARIVGLLALGAVGLSFGTVFAFLYLALPAFAASRLVNGEPYRERDAPRVVYLLHWVAAVYGWGALVTDRLPVRSPEETVQLTVTQLAPPPAGEAILRVIKGLPSMLVLGLLSLVGSLVWLWAVLSVLIWEQVSRWAFEYLVGLQRWSVRLLAYQAGLVREYPPFSMAE